MRSDRVDHLLPESIHRLDGVRDTVAGYRHMHPGDTGARQFFQAGEIGVGVEIRVTGTTDIERRERHVDRCGVAAGTLEAAMQIILGSARSIGIEVKG